MTFLQLLLLLADVFFLAFEFVANVDVYVVSIESNVRGPDNREQLCGFRKCHQRSVGGILMLSLGLIVIIDVRERNIFLKSGETKTNTKMHT